MQRTAITLAITFIIGITLLGTAHGLSDPASLSAKLEPYIDCINRHSERASSSHARYLSWIKKPSKGPTGRERIIYGLYTLYDPADCVAAVAASAGIEPANAELEAAGASYGQALVALYEITNEANTYYELEDYRDDKMKRGKSMHPALMVAFTQFENADQVMRTVVAAQNDQLQLAILQRLEQDQGRGLPFLIQNLSIHAKFLVRAGNVSQLKDINPEEYQPALEGYEGAFRELQNFAKANPEVTDEIILFSLLEMTSLEYLKSGKKLWRYHRDKHRWSSGERMFINDGSGDMVEGHPSRLVRDYNNLIQRLNSL